MSEQLAVNDGKKIKTLEDKIKKLEATIEDMKCCGNCSDNCTNKNKVVCKTCTRNLYGTRQSDNWSRKGERQ